MGASSESTRKKETPFVTQPMAGAMNGYVGKADAFSNTDPYQYIAPASPLQQDAFAGAQSLGGWEAPSQQALSMAQGAGSAGASTYQAPQLGAAAQAQAAKLGPAAQAQAAPQAEAQSLLTNLPSYMNPYTNDVVNTTLANYDKQTGAQEAQLMARKAANGGSDPFGGSRLGTQLGEFTSSNMLNRAMTEAGLRSSAFNTGAALSGQDADRRQGANFFNIGNTQQRNLFNTGQQNQFALQQGGFDQQANMYNTGAQNDFKLQQGGMDAQAAQDNARAQEAQYQRALQAAGLTAQIGGDMGQQARADLGLTADLGSLQREIEQARLGAPISQLQTVGSLLGVVPYQSYTGMDSYSKTKPSLLNQIMQIGNKAASAMSAGAG